MAKSKQDYIAQGRADGSVGKPRWTKFTKNSWQENAYDLGYNEAYKDHVSRGVDLACTLEAERTAKDLETVGRYEQAGDTRVNSDGSVSTLVDNGDGSLGVLTTGCPKVEPLVIDHATGTIKSARVHQANADALSKYGVPGSVIEHINYLHRQRATCTDEKRRLRLMVKADALRDKWAKRSASVYERAIRA